MSSRKKSSAKSARAANARAIKVSNMTAQQRPSKVKSGDDWASLLLAKLARDEEASFDDTLKARVRKAHAQMGQTRRHNEVKITVESLRPVKGQAPKTLVDIVADDNAFLIDSIVAKINEKSLLIDLLLHTTAHAQFDKSGQVVNISSKSMEDAVRVSHVHVQIKDILTAQECAQLESDLKTVIDHVSLVNRDWRAMLGRLNEARQELAQAHTPYSAFEVQQFCAFLDYLHDNNFTLLAYKSYQVASRKGDARGLAMKAVKDSGLGLLHDQIKSPLIDEINEGLPRNMQPVQYPLPAISVSKTDVSSTVHRHVPMDVIAVKIYDSKGHIKGEHVFLGLFTSVTYSRSLSDVPYLREKIDNVMAHTGFRAGSHDHKALRHILERYPRDEIFQMSVPELLHTGQSILRLQERQRIALYMRENLFGKTVSCLVYIPRDRFSTRLRRQIGGILERALDGKIANFYTTMDDSFYARVMFVISRQGKILHSVDHKAVEMMLQDAGQTWAERLNTALSESQREEDSLTRYTQRYGEAFPVSYTTRYLARQAVFDIYKIEDVLRTGKLQLDLYKPDSCGPRQLRLKIYSPDTPINLSDVLPILENMGLRVVSELPFEVSPQGLEQPRTVWIHDFLAQAPETDQPLDLALVKENFEQSFTDIWYGHIDADGLNKLVVNAGLTGRQVTILRTYVRYMRQIGYPYSRPYIQTALTTNPKIAYALAMMFKAQFDPKAQKNADARVSEYAKVIEQALEKVESLDQDRILRSLKALMDATLRTNYFLRDEQGQPKPFISIKLDSRQLLDLPEPRPYREIFVYSPRVEAVHLRGDKIARGGIRWSDRHEDFRTEVLGLMKAQMVKNALIVPMGAKGGFVVKAKFKDRAKFQAEGIECYRTMVRGMLDITDNLKGSKVIPPKDVVRRDGDDPYLVVAADKGTATFSDIANAISKEYDFWLGDAFASGGSAGYDHKKMGITARGAWESVKMHFRALNHDTQKRPFDVVGVGDMGGDVFGNGMLQSDQIRLVGAFNHVHIFCDPNPDPKSSFAERKRLFEKVQGWDHYDLKKLSAGGQIYSRSEKLLTLTPEIQARFDITKSKVTPLELMQAILKARTDLIFFGGIGTYIKSSFETHNDVGDKANDAIRIDGRDVRAKVIGEGANLGVTQRGRVEFSDQGGRINTDFLDNSGGVDTSDHEVNIKILFSDIMRSGKNTLDIKARNQMLSQMREEVGSHIIRDNYQQSQAISLAEFSGRETLALQEEFIADLERDYGLNRVLEGLPDTETVQQRLRNGKGLTRPELCVLHAHAKILFTQELLASDVPDSPEMQSWLRDYFPLPLQKKFPDAIAQHRLRREIIATSIANSMVNRMGATFIKATSKKTGASVAAITRAYVIVRDVFNLRKLWDDIEALDNKVPAEVQLKAMRAIAQLAEREILWFLTRLGHTPDLTQDTKDYSQGLEVLLKNLDKLVGEEQRMTIAQRQSAAVENGLPLALARHLALVPVLSSACDIIRIALESKTDLALTAKIYFSLGQRFHLDWLRQQARFITSEDPWHRDAAAALIDQFYSSQAGLTIRVMKELSAFKKAQDPLAQWINKNPDLFAQVTPLIERLRGIGTVDLAMLVIAEQRLRGLAGL